MEEPIQNPAQPEQPNKAKHRSRIVPLLLAGMWLASLALTAALTVVFLRTSGASELDILADAMALIRDNYYFYKQEDDHMIDGAIAGMADSFGDVYTEYYTKDEYAELTRSNSGYYTGIGIVVTRIELGVYQITTVYSGTPAERAGILAGDYLIRINDVSAEGLELDAFLDAMNTEIGKENTLVLRRGEEQITVTVASEEVYSPSVSEEMLTDTIGYIRLSGFHGECVTEMKEAIEALREQGMESLVFDLRGNPGGSLYDARDIADLFLPKGAIITTLRTRDEITETLSARTEGFEFPVVVLVNAGSASASELVTGALQDNGRAYVIGTRTFGKGIVQTYVPVAATGGYIKMTTEAYYTPSGVCIHEIGITPDETVELPTTEDGLWTGEDTQLAAAIAHLERQDAKK